MTRREQAEKTFLLGYRRMKYQLARDSRKPATGTMMASAHRPFVTPSGEAASLATPNTNRAKETYSKADFTALQMLFHKCLALVRAAPVRIEQHQILNNIAVHNITSTFLSVFSLRGRM